MSCLYLTFWEKFSLPLSVSAGASILLSLFSTFLGSLGCGAFAACAAFLLGSASSQWKCYNVRMHFTTLWCNLLGVVGILSCCFECTYWRSVCYPLSIGCNSFSLPLWVDFSLGYPEGGELAFLQLSFFFNFSPSEVVTNEIQNISKKCNFQEIKTIKNENSPLDQICPSSSILVNVPFLCT